MSERTYFGVYRGTVYDARDPQRRGRLMVRVPSVNGKGPLGWALPMAPVGVGLTLPKVGDPVWVSFENGDPTAPVWQGTWRPEAVAAVAPPPPPPPPPEPGGSTTYQQYSFTSPAASWPVNHGLGRIPSVTVLDASGAAMLAQVEHGSTTAFTVTHAQPTVGSVHLTA